MLFAFPSATREEIERLARVRGGITYISEIRLRCYGACSVTIRGERTRLCSRIDQKELSELLMRLSGGADYSLRDSLGKGYASLGSGVRVGVAGSAGYDGGNLVGISGITSLVFRIPSGRCDFADELVAAFLECKRGMLIYSPPGVGKTAALRSLVSGLALSGVNVALVDERHEFCYEDFREQSVDVLSGYRRADGFEIALRNLSPDVIAVDEVGRLDEVRAVLESLGSGVRLAITAHAGSAGEIRARSVTRPLIESGTVDLLVGLTIENGVRKMMIEEVGNETHRSYNNADRGNCGFAGIFEARTEEASRM